MKKTLSGFILDNTFVARRHHELLAGRLVRWEKLAAIQQAYVAADSDWERRQLALLFEKAVRALHAHLHESTHRRSVLARKGPRAAGCKPSDFGLGKQEFDRLCERWEAWEHRHGLAWRAAHPEWLTDEDRERLVEFYIEHRFPDYELLVGDEAAIGAYCQEMELEEQTFDAVEEMDASLRAEYLVDNGFVESDPPDPPGW